MPTLCNDEPQLDCQLDRLKEACCANNAHKIEEGTQAK